MLKWLKRLFFPRTPTYTAEALTNEFLEAVELEENDRDDFPLNLVLKFQNAIGEGNSINRLHFRREGTVFYRVEMLAGDTVYSINFNPSDDDFEIVAVDSDGQVEAVDKIEIREIAPDNLDHSR